MEKNMPSHLGRNVHQQNGPMSVSFNHDKRANMLGHRRDQTRRLDRLEASIRFHSSAPRKSGREVRPGKYETLSLGALKNNQEWESEQESNVEKLFEGVDIDSVYGKYRSFKRGSITWAHEGGVPQTEEELMR
jgi:hypothetical protein